MDRAWWRVYGEEVGRIFEGERLAPVINVKHAKHIDFYNGGNSGAGAISLAAHYGAKRIVLLGYDCQYTDGKKHWHGDHPKTLGNAMSMPKWANQFKEVAVRIKDVEVINATRQTALDIWPCEKLEDALAGSRS